MSSGKDRGKHDGGRDESGRAGRGRSGAVGPSTPPPWQPRGPKEAELAADKSEDEGKAASSPTGGTPGRGSPHRE
jgi:hypothetical protein